MVGFVLTWVTESPHGVASEGSSGIGDSSERSEITEKASTSNGVDGRLGLGDDEKDDTECLRSARVVAAFVGDSSRL